MSVDVTYPEGWTVCVECDRCHREMSEATWAQPLKWDRDAAKAGVRRRVFCGSMCDVFEGRDDLDVHRTQLWSLINETPNLTWLLLTKRPENVRGMVPAGWVTPAWLKSEDYGCPRPLPPLWPSNVWAGTTVEDQEHAELRIPHLLGIPAPVRFLSVEPMLGLVDLDRWMPRVGWVICGGESGPHHRPTDPEWVRDLRDQCVRAGVPFHFKQWGGRNPKAGGRLLDGRMWDEVPR